MAGTRTKCMTALAVFVLVGASATSAQGSRGHDDEGTRTKLIGYQEVPAAISTEGNGTFRARMVGDDAFTFKLSYDELSSHVQQAHIHFGQRHIAGGISVFLCSNLAPPAGPLPPTCPESGEVTGTITAANVIGPTGQGISPGEFEELLDAIRAGVAYVNVHTDTFPTGEIRGQLGRGHHHHHHD